jgi:hypothetical protein
MPIGGESIGRAYVKIIADGSGFGDDLEREIESSEPQMKAAGRNTSKAFNEGYDEESKKWSKKSQKQQLADLNKSLGKWQAAGAFAGSKYGKGLQDFLHKKFKDIGDQMFRDINEEIRTGTLDFDSLEDQLQNFAPRVAAATRKIRAEQDRIQVDKKREKEQAALLKRQTEANRRYAEEVVRQHRMISTEVDKSHRAVGRGDGIFARLQTRMKGVGDTVGRMFGRGSRNDFLNFFGGFVSIAPRVIGALAGVGSWVAGLGEQFNEVRKSAGGGFSGIISGLGSLAGAGLPGLVAAAGLAIVMIEGLFFTLGPLTSGLVMAAGAVLALAGSIGFALVGGIVAAAGALVPLAASIGVVALAIGGLNKKTKVFKDLAKEWKSLQKATAKALFGEKQEGLEAVQNLLEGIRPLVLDVAEAVGDLLKDLGKATGTDAFRDGIKEISEVLTPMVPLIGSIVKNVGTFLGRAFVAAEKPITEFLGWLDRVTKAMADFGKPGKGGKKSPLAVFFEDAWESAKKVGRLIGNLGKVIGTVFSAGKGTGDSLIDKMADAAEDLNKWLTSAEGQAALKTLFEDAEKLFDKLGEIGGKVLEVIDALDTPTNRLIFFQLLEISIDVLDFLASVFEWVDKINVAMLEEGSKAIASWSTGWTNAKQRTEELANGTAWEVLKGHIREVTDGTAWDSLKGRMGEAFDGTAFTTFKQRAGEAVTGVKGFFAPLGTWFAGVGAQIGVALAPGWATAKQRASEAASGIKGFFGGIGGFFSGVGTSIATNVSTGFNRLKQRATEAKTGIVAAFSGLSGKIIKGAGNVSASFSSWVSGLPGRARTAKDGIANGFSGLAKSAMAKAGSIASAFRTWVSGTPAAAKKIANSISEGFSGLGKKAMQKAGSITAAMASWASGVKAKAKGVADDIVAGFKGLADRIVRAIGTIIPKIKMPDIPRPVVEAIVKVVKPKTAAGGIFSGAQERIIGEAGPEAVVPLNRPLSRVDPAVRALSAFAQGLKVPGSSNGPSIGRQIDVGGITINTPTTDPRAVASEVVTRMTFASYI